MAPARILRTIPPPSATWNPLVPFALGSGNPLLPLTLGSGLEFENNQGQTTLDYKMFLEYNFSQTLKLNIEPDIQTIIATRKGVRSVTAFSDTDIGVEWEFLRERRYRPALTIIPGSRLPTATDPDVGSKGHDYVIGLMASKDLTFVDTDLTVQYTSIGDPKEQDILEIVLAVDWHVNRRFDVEAELVRTIGAGGRPRGASRVDGTEGTLGVAWHINKRLKVEQGALLRSDGTWQLAWAWEWSFTGN